jgi:tRNA G10  N-methylase Trm11
MKTEYIFHLGREIELCQQELFYFLQKEKIKFSKIWQYKNLLALKFDKEIPVDYFQEQLGGIVKISLILDKKTTNGFNEEVLLEWLNKNKKATVDKYFFGISLISDNKINERKKIVERSGLTWKKLLKEEKISSRFVIDKNLELSSVTVTKNKLLSDQGQEFYLIFVGPDVHLSTALSCQNFSDYSFRDFSRPGRDQFSGMIPPKLARMMINISCIKKDAVLLDAFCGSGTIITEAMLMGYKNLIGSDISEKAIRDTQTNIAWVKEKYNCATSPKIFVCPAEEIVQELKPSSIDAVVAEPYLGKPLRGRETSDEIRKQRHELVELYNHSLFVLSKVLKPNGVIVLVLPVVNFNKERMYIYVEQILAGTGLKVDKMSPGVRGTLNYEREDQRVGREIIRLVK